MGRIDQGVSLHKRLSFLLPVFLVAASLNVAAGAERTISAVDLFDRMRGMWLGELLGNAAGRPTEGVYAGSTPNPDPCVPWQIKQVWDGDDDTDLEYVALDALETYGFDCNSLLIAEQWLEHVGGNGVYVANKQAFYLMRDGHVPPETGSRTLNEHWYSIDAQISTEILGAVSPGLPQAAIDLTGRFGRITNSGFAVHAAQFYAALYANAFFEPNVVELVFRGLEAIPASSRTAAVVGEVLNWYLDDASDGTLDWRATRAKLYQKYQGPGSFGRYYNWVESTINVGATVLALLYGQGDFKQTVQIAVLAGWDCDCNPATAGGLLGIIHGFSGLPTDLTDPALCGNLYMNVSRPGLPDLATELPQYEAISTIAIRMLILAQENIVRHGGFYVRDGFLRVYHIPEPQAVVPDPEQPDPNGPAGLVARALAAGITVTPTASVQHYDPEQDRSNLNSIIDGIIDNSYNGRRPYSTYAANLADRPPMDWYELTFSQPVRFDKLVFHEGDIVWGKLNTYYRQDQPLGGFFEDLTVEVLQDGQYLEPADLQMSPALDRFQMYQTITFTFAPTVGRAIRILGTPGGSRHFTTILELEVEGGLLEDP
jgi:ADP-ribosylglycohydrolase